MNNNAFIGVTAREFRGFDLGQQSEIYVPLAMYRLFEPTGNSSSGKELSWLHLIGRLKETGGMEAERAATDATFRQILKTWTGKETQARIVFATAAQGCG